MVEEIHSATSLIWDMSQRSARSTTRIVRISELENQADALYNTVIADLFKRDGPRARSRS